MRNVISWWQRRQKQKTAFEFGQSVAHALIRDIELQAEALFAPRRLAVIRLLDERLRSIDFVGDPDFGKKLQDELFAMVEGWSEQTAEQREELKAVALQQLGAEMISLAPDLIDQVIGIEIDKQKQTLVAAAVKHSEDIMKLQNRYSRLERP